MSEVSQFSFPLTEVAALLVKKEGIKEGHWMIGVNFAIAVATAGPDKDRVRPSALVSVDNLVLTKVVEPGPLTINAEDVWKKSATK